jgi:hypothetical protein
MTHPGKQPTLERAIWAAAFAIVLFALSWTVLHHGFYEHRQIIDTPVYQHYGNLIADGKVPYRDFELEYPPGALPMFALPGLAKHGQGQDVTPGFRRTFETLMWLCGAGALTSSGHASLEKKRDSPQEENADEKTRQRKPRRDQNRC